MSGDKLSILLKEGERGLLIGRTGSGKTKNAVWQMRSTAASPVIIMDTKQEPGDPFAALPKVRGDKSREELLRLRGGIDEFRRLKRSDLPEYVLLQPPAEDITEPAALDEYLQVIFERFAPAFTYIDEGYAIHESGRPGPAYVRLLTQGRAFGHTVLTGVQRPRWVSVFAMSEAERYYVYKLTKGEDRKAVGDYIPGFEDLDPLAPHHFYYYDLGHDRPLLSAPVPLFEPLPPARAVSGHRWV